MRAPLRIAVLECDTPLPNTNARYHGYGGVFISLLKASAKALNQPDRLDPEAGLEITKWDVVNGDQYPKLEDVDAVLLTGSSKYAQSAQSVLMLTIIRMDRAQLFRRCTMDQPSRRVHSASPRAGSGPHPRNLLRTPDRGPCSRREGWTERSRVGGCGL